MSDDFLISYTMIKTSFKNIFLLLTTLSAVSPAIAADSDSGTNFGSPDAVENLIADDAKSIPALVQERMLDPWLEWKGGLQKRQ